MHLTLTTAMSIMEGKRDVLAECKAKLGTTLQARYCFMLPAAAINFSVVPSAYRVAFQGLVTFIWVNVLCYYKVGLLTLTILSTFFLPEAQPGRRRFCSALTSLGLRRAAACVLAVNRYTMIQSECIYIFCEHFLGLWQN